MIIQLCSSTLLPIPSNYGIPVPASQLRPPESLLPPLPTQWELWGCVPRSPSRSVHFLEHPRKHRTTLVWRKSPSSQELEGRDATRVGGNSPTKAFFSVENVFSNHTEPLINVRTALFMLPPPPQIPRFRYCRFWQLPTPLIFMKEKAFEWKPPNFPRRTLPIKCLNTGLASMVLQLYQNGSCFLSGLDIRNNFFSQRAVRHSKRTGK